MPTNGMCVSVRPARGCVDNADQRRELDSSCGEEMMSAGESVRCLPTFSLKLSIETISTLVCAHARLWSWRIRGHADRGVRWNRAMLKVSCFLDVHRFSLSYFRIFMNWSKARGTRSEANGAVVKPPGCVCLPSLVLCCHLRSRSLRSAALLPCTCSTVNMLTSLECQYRREETRSGFG